MRSTLNKVCNALSQGPLQVKQLTPTLTKYLLFFKCIQLLMYTTIFRLYLFIQNNNIHIWKYNSDLLVLSENLVSSR